MSVSQPLPLALCDHRTPRGATAREERDGLLVHCEENKKKKLKDERKDDLPPVRCSLRPSL
jgi:hypothetical protein